MAPPDPLLRVHDLRVEFGAQCAVRDVSFELFARETVGLVGESGSGKSTLARAILRLVRASRGRVEWRGEDLLTLGAAQLRRCRRDLQIIFQNPSASLDPRMTIGESIGEPLSIFEPRQDARQRGLRVAAMLERVGLRADMSRRYPHEFSGGQCQRIGIARAMILSPQLLICDEAVSSLDVSIQGQIVNLLLDLQQDAGTAMLFISHNLAVVRHLSHRVLVIYRGALVESAPRDALFGAPIHPYTRALLAAVPTPPGADVGPQRGARGADAPPGALSSAAGAKGCAFRERCPYAVAICATDTPAPAAVAVDHWVACHRAQELTLDIRYS